MSSASMPNFSTLQVTKTASLDPELLLKNRKPRDTSYLEHFLCNTPLMTKALLLLLNEQHDEDIPPSLAWIFVVTGTGIRLMRFCAETEIGNTSNFTLLMREESAYVRVLSQYTQLEGFLYIKEVVAKIIKKICDPKHGTLEIDEKRCSTSEELIKNRMAFVKVCKEMLEIIFKSVNKIPYTVREMLSMVYDVAKAKFSENAYKALGSCFFLRFIVPNMVQPDKYGFIKEVTPEIRRKLILTSKVLQLISNEAEPTDDMVAAGMAIMITGSTKKMHKFYEKVIKFSKGKKMGNYISHLPSAELSKVYVQGHVLSVFNYIVENRSGINAYIDAKSKSKEQSNEVKQKLSECIEDCLTRKIKRSVPNLHDSLM